MYIKRFSFLTLSLLIACAGTSANAAVALSDLIANNDSVVVGDLVFDQFTFSSSGDINDATEINVIVIDGGIRFQGGFSDLPGDGASTFTITYAVNALNNSEITGATLQGNPAAILSGTGSFTMAFDGIADTLMIFDDFDTQTTDLLDSTVFTTPLTGLEVQVDFNGEAGDIGGVTGSFVDQQFNVAAIPEVSSFSTWCVLMISVLGFCIINRYRSLEPARSVSRK